LQQTGRTDELIARLARLQADSRDGGDAHAERDALSSRRLFGRCSACAGEPVAGDAPETGGDAADRCIRRYHLPQGIPTGKVDPKGSARGGVIRRRPGPVVDLMKRFAAPEVAYQAHPMFGALTRNEWLVWAYKHMDHHLRQFGL
jgi:hypothetical protein